MSDYADEAGRWYAADGTPCYTIKGAKGQDRPTTLRDARKLNLYPSVTTIIRLAAAPNLERWKRDQVLLAAMTLPRVDGESSDAFIKRVEEDWQAQGKEAADVGSQIHAAIECYYLGTYFSDRWTPWVIEAAGELDKQCGPQRWHAERSFACRHEGYAGKTDLHSPEWVIDVKTKDGELPRTLYDEHVMQLAAYRHGLERHTARCGILYVGRDKPTATLIEADPKDLTQGLAMFRALLAYHQAKTGYRPESV